MYRFSGAIDASLYFNEDSTDDDFRGWANRWDAEPSLKKGRLNLHLLREKHRESFEFKTSLTCAVTVPGPDGPRVVGVIQAINKHHSPGSDSWITSSHEDSSWTDGEMQELSLFCDQVAWVLEQKSRLKSLRAAAEKHHKFANFTGKTHTSIRFGEVSLSRRAQHESKNSHRMLQDKMLESGLGWTQSELEDWLRKLHHWEFEMLDLPREDLWKLAAAMILSLDVLPFMAAADPGDKTTSNSSSESGTPSSGKKSSIVVCNFVKSLFDNYGDLPYHNAWRAITICHWVHYTVRGLEKVEAESGSHQMLSPEHQLVALLAALCVGGVGSDGLDNNAHEELDSDLHARFNGVSPVENREAQIFCETLDQDGCDLFASLPTDHRRALRQTAVSIILRNDHANHVTISHQLIQSVGHKHGAEKGATSNTLSAEHTDGETVASAIIHAFDIGTSLIGGWETAVRWSRNELMERAVAVALGSKTAHVEELMREELSSLAPAEYFGSAALQEGDGGATGGRGSEKLASAQLAFLTGVVLPFFELLAEKLGNFGGLHKAKQGIKQNQLRWHKVVMEQGREQQIQPLPHPSSKMELAAVSWVRHAITDEVERAEAEDNANGGLDRHDTSHSSHLVAQRKAFLDAAHNALPDLIRTGAAANKIIRSFRRRHGTSQSGTE